MTLVGGNALWSVLKSPIDTNFLHISLFHLFLQSHPCFSGMPSPETLVLEYFPEDMNVDGHFQPSYNIPLGIGIPMLRMSMNDSPQLINQSAATHKVVGTGEQVQSPVSPVL